MKILIADDDAIPRRMLEASLQRWGYDVVAATNGDEAWDLLTQPDGPEVAILDWQMPGIDGLEICKRIRGRVDAPYTYVILLSSRETHEDLVEGMAAGADDYLTKPFDPAKLQMRLRAGRRIIDLQSELMHSLEKVRKADDELANSRKREVETGARIQQTLLLGKPPSNLPGARAAAMTIASQTIDGDFYDFFVHNEEVFEVLIGDVMGKGIPGALVGAAVKSHIQRALSQLIYSDRGGLPRPEDIISVVHSTVTRELISLETFATLCYAQFDRTRMIVSLVDCGHTATIHLQPARGVCRRITGYNVPLGFTQQEVYRQVEASYEPGDVFLFYSDGVTEAQDERGEMFGVARLLELVKRGGNVEPTKLIERVKQAVVAFSHSSLFRDDLTCVAVKIDEVPSGEPMAFDAIAMTSRLSELGVVRNFVHKHCERVAGAFLTEEDSYQLLLAVNEAISNIVKHAYHRRSDKLIEAEAATYADRVIIRLWHYGDSFDPESAPAPVFDGTREGGFGVYMIAQCVDEVKYINNQHGRNCIQLVKKAKQA